MVAGRGTPDQAPARALAERDPQAFQEIIDMLVVASIDYLAAQIDAGAEVIQLFESWASSLHGADFERWCVAPVARIIAGLKAYAPNVPIIAFPRATSYDLTAYANETGCDGLSLGADCDGASWQTHCHRNWWCRAILTRKYWSLAGRQC